MTDHPTNPNTSQELDSSVKLRVRPRRRFWAFVAVVLAVAIAAGLVSALLVNIFQRKVTVIGAPLRPLGFAGWLWGVAQASVARGRAVSLASAVIVIVHAGGLAFSLSQRPAVTATTSTAEAGAAQAEPYSAARLAALVASLRMR